jgi:hypothetical protein
MRKCSRERVIAQWNSPYGCITLTTTKVYETNGGFTEWSVGDFKRLCKGRVLPTLIDKVYGDGTCDEILSRISEKRG